MTVAEKDRVRDLERQLAEASANAVFRERIKELEARLLLSEAARDGAVAKLNAHLDDTDLTTAREEAELRGEAA